MSQLDRRQVFLALAAFGAAAGTPVAAAALPPIDPKGAQLIGQAHLAQHPGKLAAARLTAHLLPHAPGLPGLGPRCFGM